MPRHTNVQHGRELGVGVQRTWARPWQIWPLTLDDHETAAAPARPRTSTQAPRLSRPNHERPERRVAVKQLYRQSGASAREAELANQRALREAQLTARQALIADRYRLLHCVGCGGFQHPHAVWVFDAVEQDGELTRQLDPMSCGWTSECQCSMASPPPASAADAAGPDPARTRSVYHDQPRVSPMIKSPKHSWSARPRSNPRQQDLGEAGPAQPSAGGRPCLRVRSDPPRRERRLRGYVAC